MHKFALVFGAVVMVSLVAATLGHAYCPAFCVAVKPMAWPFIVLAAYAVRRVYKTHKKEK